MSAVRAVARLPALAAALWAGGLCAQPSVARAAPASVETGGAAEEGAGAETSASLGGPVESGRQWSVRQEPGPSDAWIHRWAPTRGMVELGLFGGVWFPNRRLELFDPTMGLPNEGHQPLRVVAPEVGLRVGYYPLRFVGAELEGAVMPARTRGTGEAATVWGLRGHVVAQLGLWSVTPFLLAGTGLVGVASDAPPVSLGREQDVAIHFGGGVKFFVDERVLLRLDIRDVVSNRLGVGEGLVSSPEILLGVSVSLGREKRHRARPANGDRDGDRVLDRDDYCPDVFGARPRGCPQVCIDDNDGDGIENPIDKCPEDPENRNGFEDGDGCPDEVPPELTQLAGIMDGIRFDTDKDTIKSDSIPTLDNAVDVMTRYPEIRVLITGHTDSAGGYRHNVDLSRRRADAVREHLVAGGIEAGRIDTRGVGPDEPLAGNDTEEGRALNRRIEFTILPES